MNIKKSTVKASFATLVFPWVSFASEADFIEAKNFIKKVYESKNAREILSEHATKLNFLSYDECNTTYTDNKNSYAHVHFQNKQRSGSSFVINKDSKIQFERDQNDEIVKLTIQELEYFDCEEEGCSQEDEVRHEVDFNQITTQTHEQQSNYNYELITDTCKI